MFQGMYPHSFKIQAGLLVKAVGVFNLRQIAPGGQDPFGAPIYRRDCAQSSASLSAFDCRGVATMTLRPTAKREGEAG